MKPGNLLVILQVILVSVAFSQTYIPPGDVSGTLGFNGSPYYIQGDITIPNDSTLTIEPGVSVIFEGYYALNVQGRLLAIGTDSNKIEFTINDTTGFHNPETTLGGWNGIQFIDTPTNNDSSKIIYCTLQHGKAVGSSPPDNTGGAIFISNINKVLISNCLISNNSAGGSDSPSGGGIGLHFASITLVENEISHNRAWDGGGIQIWESNVGFRNNIISNNKADEGGGGIWIGGLSNIEFNNDSIIANVAVNNGGGIVCWQTSNTNLDSVVLSNNIATWGGGMAVFSGELTMDSCLFSYNGASHTGGGLGSESGTIQINNTVFEGDTATLFGGAVAAYSSQLSLSDCFLVENGTGIRGGGIHSDFSNINIINTTFERDTSTIFGGAIAIGNSELFLNSCNLVDNTAGILGGAIHADFSTINITHITFNGDTAGNSGGAMFLWQSNLHIENSEFNNESAALSGGAISSDSSSILINNSIFSDNTAEFNGGAILFNSDSLSIYNTNFIHNNAIWGGAINIGRSELILQNSIIEGNFSEHGGAISIGKSNAEVNNVSFVQNSSIWGGAVDALNTSMLIDSCTFFQNEATENGGGIQYNIDTTEFSQPYVFKLLNSSFIENAAFYRGALDIHQFNSEISLVDVKIDKCEFISNSIDRAANLSIAGFIDDFVISNSIFRGNTAVVRTATCQFNDYTKGKVSNSLFASNYTVGGGSAVSIGLGSDVEFANCSFTNNLGTLGAALTQRVGGSATFINSIVWGNRPYNIILNAVNDTNPCHLNVNYCNIEYGLDSIIVNDSVSVVNFGAENIDADPLFIDILNNDFHLQDLSPCIASGIDSIEIAGLWRYAPLTDIEGNPRPYPVGSMPDMGAYESQYPVKVEDNNLNLPTEFALYQNYPNPFNPSTIISWQLPVTSDVQLRVCDILGREIETLVNGHKEAGHHSVEFDASALPSGVYFYTLTTGDFISTKKMILLK